MPRKSSAALTVLTPKRPRVRLAPSDGAPAEVVEIFAEIVRSAPADHFWPSDAPLIQGYAEAIATSRRAARELERDGPVIGGRVSPWLIAQEKSHRAIAALSMRLRLSPQHRADSRSAGRKANGLQPSIYEVMADDDD